MTDFLRELAWARKDVADASATLDELMNTLRDTLEWQDAQARKAAATAEVTTLTGQTKEYYKGLYLALGKTGLTKGVNVRQKTSMSYNRIDAIEWAKKHLQVAVTETLDEKLFEATATALIKSQKPLDFVVVSTEPEITLAQDLSELQVADPNAYSTQAG